MPRDNFISDNLINIREQLRKDHSDKKSSDVELPDPVVNTADSQGSREFLLRELPVTSPRMTSLAPHVESAKRELAGKIRHDYSRVAAELENLDRKRVEAVGFMEFLASHKETVEKLDCDSDLSSKELDKLSYEYYLRSGRWKAFQTAGAVDAARLNEPAVHSPLNSKSLIIAIIASALIISATLLVVFL